MDTLLLILTDHSGSMAGAASQACRGVNGFIESQRTVPGRAIAGHWGFSNAMKVLQETTDLRSLRRMESYPASGGTALYDSVLALLAIGERIAVSSPKARKILFVSSDGDDRDSRVSAPDFKRQLSGYLEKGWTLISMCATERDARSLIQYGFVDEFVFVYDASRTEEGFQRASQYVSKARGPIM